MFQKTASSLALVNCFLCSAKRTNVYTDVVLFVWPLLSSAPELNECGAGVTVSKSTCTVR